MFRKIAIGVFIAMYCSLTPAFRMVFRGSTPLDPRMDQLFPAGSIALANLPERTGYYIGPPFGSGLYTFQFEAQNVEKLNQAIKAFSEIKTSKPELRLTARPCEICNKTNGHVAVSSSSLHYTFTVWQTTKYKEMRELVKGTDHLDKEYPTEAPPPPVFTIFLDHVSSETMSKLAIPGNVEQRKS